MRCVRYDILVVRLRLSHVFDVFVVKFGVSVTKRFASGNEIAHGSKLAKLATKVSTKILNTCVTVTIVSSLIFWSLCVLLWSQLKNFRAFCTSVYSELCLRSRFIKPNCVLPF